MSNRLTIGAKSSIVGVWGVGPDCASDLIPFVQFKKREKKT